MRGPLNAVFVNWAALIALGALPYLKMRQHLGIESPETLQWSLVAVAVLGTAGALIAVRAENWK